MLTPERKNRDLISAPAAIVRRQPQRLASAVEVLGDAEPEPLNLYLLCRTYLKLVVPLMVLGCAIGIAAGVLTTPQYEASVMLEIQPVSQDFLGKLGMDPFSSTYNLDGANLQTQVLLLESGPFKQKVIEKMMSGPAPAPVFGQDLLGRLRLSLFPARIRHAQALPNALEAAAASFTVRIINETRLVELTAQSANPVVTSTFLNNIASEFAEGTMQQRNEASEKTKRWLASHLDETKAKLEAAEQAQRSFVLQSGNVFASSDSTVDDVKLKQLQTEMAAAETARINAQSQYESAVRSDAASSPQILADATIQTLRAQLAELERQKGILLTTLKPAHPRVKAIDDQEAEIEAAMKRESAITLSRLQNEYQGALRHEKLLVNAYVEEGQTVSAQASKAAQYASLHRDVETLRTVYDSLLQEMNKTEVAQSAPVIPVRLVEPSLPPQVPYKPKLQTNMLLGLVMGGAFSVGIIFVREKLHRGLRTPESVQRFVKVPQLGVIPAVAPAARPTLIERFRPKAGDFDGALPFGENSASALALAIWSQRLTPVADSFRATLSAIRRHLKLHDAKVLLVSSSIPREGKTSVVSNLGIALSEAGQRVVIVDADFYRPALSRIFSVKSEINLLQLLRDEVPVAGYDIESICAPTGFPGLYILPSETTGVENPALVYSPRLPELLERLRHEFDLVLVDAPPILYPADTRVISQMVDGAVVVIRARSTEKQVIRTAISALYEDGVPIVGTILNDWVPTAQSSGMNYYSSYYSQGNRS